MGRGDAMCDVALRLIIEEGDACRTTCSRHIELQETSNDARERDRHGAHSCNVCKRDTEILCENFCSFHGQNLNGLIYQNVRAAGN